MKRVTKIIFAGLIMFLTQLAIAGYYENEYFLSGMATSALVIWFGYMMYDFMKY